MSLKTSWPGLVDQFISNLRSKKFVVLIIATVLLCVDQLQSWHWVVVAGAYMGVNVWQKREVLDKLIQGDAKK